MSYRTSSMPKWRFAIASVWEKKHDICGMTYDTLCIDVFCNDPMGHESDHSKVRVEWQRHFDSTTGERSDWYGPRIELPYGVHGSLRGSKQVVDRLHRAFDGSLRECSPREFVEKLGLTVVRWEEDI